MGYTRLDNSDGSSGWVLVLVLVPVPGLALVLVPVLVPGLALVPVLEAVRS